MLIDTKLKSLSKNQHHYITGICMNHKSNDNQNTEITNVVCFSKDNFKLTVRPK